MEYEPLGRWSRSPAGISGVCYNHLVEAVLKSFLCSCQRFAQRTTVCISSPRTRAAWHGSTIPSPPQFLGALCPPLARSCLDILPSRVRCTANGTSGCLGTVLTTSTSCQCLRWPCELVFAREDPSIPTVSPLKKQTGPSLFLHDFWNPQLITLPDIVGRTRS